MSSQGSNEPAAQLDTLGAMKTWLPVRLVLVALSFLQGALSDEVVAPPEGVSLSLLAIVFVFGIVGMLFVVGIQRVNPRSAPVWRRPRWSINPFSMKEPLQFFHLGGFVLISVGVGSAVRLLVLGQPITASVLFAPTFGIGMLAGVYVCTLAFRGKMERTQPTLQADRPASGGPAA
jgi:hypothetical protein